MSKVPLTPAGIADLQDNLYALADGPLFVEAAAVHADFPTWVDEHIILSPGQLGWLRGIDQLFLDYLAAKTAIALRNRLPLELTLPTASATPTGKWFLDKDPITPCWQGTGDITATGTLSYELGYS